MQIAFNRQSAGPGNRSRTTAPRQPRRLPPDNAHFWQLGAKLRRTLPWQSAAELPQTLIHRAVNEAEALALQTPFPTLVLPVLAEERVSAMSQWHSRQQEIFARSAIVLTA